MWTIFWFHKIEEVLWWDGGGKNNVQRFKNGWKSNIFKSKAYVNIFAENIFSIFEGYYSPNLFIKIFQEKICETIIY